MKIPSQNLPAPASGATTSAAEAAKIARVKGFQSPESGAPVAHDEVQLSGLASRIGESQQALAADHTKRVEALAKAYQGGHYTVEPRQLSQKLVTAWLANGSAPTNER